mmetsp:Transcript_6209/g.7121  ORF Transcript_6209/g.7121 Transcript_6209/m.7121 type:complete len:80 (-) Transcript_6209:98-337(-)
MIAWEAISKERWSPLGLCVYCTYRSCRCAMGGMKGKDGKRMWKKERQKKKKERKRGRETCTWWCWEKRHNRMVGERNEE